MDIIICDDQTLYRRGMAAVAAELHPDAKVVQVGSGEELSQFGGAPEDVGLILINAGMIEDSPALAVEKLRGRFPGAALVLVVTSARRAEVRSYVAEGAAGVVLRSEPPARILTGLRHVMAGGLLLPVEVFRDQPSAKAPPASGNAGDDKTPVLLSDALDQWKLTRRQAAVLALVGRGWSNRRIAEDLGVSEGTVKVHVNAVLKILKVRNRTQAALRLSRRDKSGSSRRG